MILNLNVNGENHAVDVDPETPLLWVLRDVIGLTGTKYGCGIEKCWACTVWIDGEANKSCDYDVSSAVGKKITTIEGLSPQPGTPAHPLQQAWIKAQVPQCGYCQSGMLMAAAARMNADGGSTKEVANELENICVCGTHQRIRNALNLV
jgi:isoquinoline 1-oxidoreductase alpha subunit